MPSGWGPLPHKLRVDAYWNLNKKAFSIRSLEGLIIGYVQTLFLSDVDFIIRQSGREKQLREGNKTIHAFYRGEIQYPTLTLNVPPVHREVIYNPYKHSSFVLKTTGEPVKKAKMILLDTMLGDRMVYPRVLIVDK